MTRQSTEVASGRADEHVGPIIRMAQTLLRIKRVTYCALSDVGVASAVVVAVVVVVVVAVVVAAVRWGRELWSVG